MWAKETGDIVSNTEVVNKIKDGFSEPYLRGQNHYVAFAEIAKNVNGKLAQSTDSAIEDLFREAVKAYMFGEKTKDRALADFKRQAADRLLKVKLGFTYLPKFPVFYTIETDYMAGVK